MDFEEFADLLSRQRAVRAFDTSKPVADDMVEKMLRAATSAPSGSNTQPWRFVVVTDPEVKGKLRAIYDEVVISFLGGPAAGQTPWSEIPLLMVVATEPPPPAAGPTVGPSVFPAVQNLLLAAHVLGLGSVLTTLWKGREADVKQVLGLPDDYEVHAIIPIGWPDRAYGRNKRKAISEVAYRDRYGNAW